MKETVYSGEPLHANKNISRLAKLNCANDASRGEKNKHDKQPRNVKLAECVSSSRWSTCASDCNDSKAFHAQAVTIVRPCEAFQYDKHIGCLKKGQNLIAVDSLLPNCRLHVCRGIAPRANTSGHLLRTVKHKVFTMNFFTSYLVQH